MWLLQKKSENKSLLWNIWNQFGSNISNSGYSLFKIGVFQNFWYLFNKTIIKTNIHYYKRYIYITLLETASKMHEENVNVIKCN